ncbi:hypothetical protein [Hansschlegelia zhihuaiae]|uniref:Uncharacterized protein n=1 Tax=Hansschlegelia zhihuaiae TaxID=405005 RepID=A0A4Q0M679_9HYPH|nr:hypothetical protein [Hansschlegelia zhihuaiae]RXF68551.1 hypothetical protein EK403_19865 [Hansschlegelia zhihuaiae]
MTFRVFPTRQQAEDDRPASFGRREQQDAARRQRSAKRLKRFELSALAVGSGLLALYAIGLI